MQRQFQIWIPCLPVSNKLRCLKSTAWSKKCWNTAQILDYLGMYSDCGTWKSAVSKIRLNIFKQNILQAWAFFRRQESSPWPRAHVIHYHKAGRCWVYEYLYMSIQVWMPYIPQSRRIRLNTFALPLLKNVTIELSVLNTAKKHKQFYMCQLMLTDISVWTTASWAPRVTNISVSRAIPDASSFKFPSFPSKPGSTAPVPQKNKQFHSRLWV